MHELYMGDCLPYGMGLFRYLMNKELGSNAKRKETDEEGNTADAGSIAGNTGGRPGASLSPGRIGGGRQ